MNLGGSEFFIYFTSASIKIEDHLMSFTWNKFYGRLLKSKIYIHCSVVWIREWEKEYILSTLCSILSFNFCQMHQNEAIVTYQIGLFIEMMIEVPTWTHWKSFITKIHEWIHDFFCSDICHGFNAFVWFHTRIN